MRGKTSGSLASKSANQKSKPNLEPTPPPQDDNDFSKKRPKHYNYEDMFSRISAEVHIHSNLESVVKKLNSEGTLDKIYETMQNIIDNEADRRPAMEDFDLKEQLFNNLFIFKENFKNVLTIVVDDLWNNHLCNPQVISSLIGGGPKESKPNGATSSKQKVSPIQIKPSQNIFPIKEATDEEEFETPVVKQQSQASIRQSQRTEPEEAVGPDSYTDRNGKDFQNRMSIENDKDHEQDGRKRDSRSVDHTRGSYSKTYDQEMKRTTKPSPSNGAGGGKKVNLDVFSLASGGRTLKKPKVGSLFGKT